MHGYIKKIVLNNFRNHSALELKLNNSPIIIHGKNGIGKTNVLEAISFLSPGRGLRSSKLEEVQNVNSQVHWSVYSEFDFNSEHKNIATGTVISDTNRLKRILKIDGDIQSQNDVLNLCRIVWLTPQMSGIFLDSASVRRKFFDRIVYNFIPSHATAVNKYENLVRERIKLLTEGHQDEAWLEILEKKIAEIAIDIANSRIKILQKIEEAISRGSTNFLKPVLRINGAIEDFIISARGDSALEFLVREFKSNRSLDAKTGKTNFGTHKSDLEVYHPTKNTKANFCSTGEQKAFLISIILAQVLALKEEHEVSTILLLDDVVAHLDEERRTLLLEEVLSLNIQTWMSGTDKEMFESIEEQAMFISL